MSQINLIFQKDEKPMFLSFWNKFEKDISGFSNISIKNDDDTLGLSFDVKEKKKNLLVERINRLVAESMVLYYKQQFFELNIVGGFSSSIEKLALVKALATFDKAYDINFALSQLDCSESVNIKSFFQFRLSSLKERWQEIAVLFQENLQYLLTTESCIELVRNLVEITENEYESVFVCFFEDNIILRDSKGLELVQPISSHSTAFLESVVGEIISLSPKRIYLNFSAENLPELTDSLCCIFDKKIMYNA